MSNIFINKKKIKDTHKNVNNKPKKEEAKRKERLNFIYRMTNIQGKKNKKYFLKVYIGIPGNLCFNLDN